MALPNNKKRTITINDQAYYWVASGKNDCIHLVIENTKQQRILAAFDYNTIHLEANPFNRPFVITPYIVRQTILYALEKQCFSQQKTKQINLGNLTTTITIEVEGKRKTHQLILLLEKRMHQQTENIQYILDSTKELIDYGEWLIGFENMLINLEEIKFKLTLKESLLVQEIVENMDFNWKEEWSELTKLFIAN